VTLTGGEPLAHPDFWRLAERVSQASDLTDFAVLSSGAGLDQASAARLAALKPAFVQLSLDGGRDAHDALRGVGAFDRTLTAAKRLVRAGAPLFLAFTAHQENYLEIGTVAALGREWGAKKVWADRFVPLAEPLGDGPRPLTSEQTLAFCQALRKACGLSDRTTRVVPERGLQFLAGGGRPYACEAGRSLLALLPNGDALPCRRLPVILGNAHESPLAEIYATAPYARFLRERRFDQACASCAYRLGCRSGSLCQAYARHGEGLGRDPGCWLDLSCSGRAQ
jgi:radical SAM protein with 4Fe4S-binding SPASM domain